MLIRLSFNVQKKIFLPNYTIRIRYAKLLLYEGRQMFYVIPFLSNMSMPRSTLNMKAGNMNKLYGPCLSITFMKNSRKVK